MRPGTVNLRSFHIGVDLGQRVDHTAFVVVEQSVVVTARMDRIHFDYERERRMCVRMVERVALGSGFDAVAAELERLTQCEELRGGTVTTTVDGTGIGSVVTEDLRKRRLRGELFPVVITGGLRDGYQKGFFTTPRTELLLGVERALEQQGLEVAGDLPMWGALKEEMAGMRKVQTVRGPRYETLGRHDDLVFALALALFGVRMRVLPVEGEAVRRRRGF